MGFHLSEGGKGVDFGREVGVRRLVIIVGSGSLCSLQLCWGAAALLPAAQKLASLGRNVSEAGTGPGGDSWAEEWYHRFRVIRDELTGRPLIRPAETVFPGRLHTEGAERLV